MLIIVRYCDKRHYSPPLARLEHTRSPGLTHLPHLPMALTPTTRP